MPIRNSCSHGRHRDTYANCDSNGHLYTDSDSHGFAYINTGDSLSTVTDDRPYQGCQHTVQFHGTSKRH